MRIPPFITASGQGIQPRNLITASPDSDNNINLVGFDSVVVSGAGADADASWHGKLIVIDDEAPITPAITLQAGMPEGFWFKWAQVDTAQGVFVNGAGVTLESIDDNTATAEQWAVGEVIKLPGVDTFILTGQIAVAP